LEAWETFGAAHPEAVTDLRYKLDIPENEGATLCELPSLQKHLSNLTFDHVTHLAIRGLEFTTDDLWQISKIPNLEVLLLRAMGRPNADNPVYNDYFLTIWCRTVLQEGNLSQLKVLIMRRFHLSPAILKELASFPAIKLCNIQSNAMGFNYFSDPDGWEYLGA
jgi:hypothetical protein